MTVRRNDAMFGVGPDNAELELQRIRLVDPEEKATEVGTNSSSTKRGRKRTKEPAIL